MPRSHLILRASRMPFHAESAQRLAGAPAVRRSEVAPHVPLRLDAQRGPAGARLDGVVDRRRDRRVEVHPRFLACRAPRRARLSMAQVERSILAVLPHDRSPVEFGLAVAALIRARHPVHTAKRLAGDLSRKGQACTVRTAENILAGHLSAKTLTRIVQAYGLQLLIDAGAEVTGTTLEQHLTEQVERASAVRERSERQEAASQRLKELVQRRPRGDLFAGAR